jgi:hypothetical protein
LNYALIAIMERYNVLNEGMQRILTSSVNVAVDIAQIYISIFYLGNFECDINRLFLVTG